MSPAFTYIDLLVVLVILGSISFAVYRGFVSETLSVFAGAAAAFASLYFGPWVAPRALSLVSSWWLAVLLAYAAVFMVVFIPLSFASHRFAQGVKDSAVGPLDRVLGAVFGVVRGLAILGFLYIVFGMIVPQANQPEVLTASRTLPLIVDSADVIRSIVPNHDALPVASPEPRAADVEPKPEAADLDRVKTKPVKRHHKGYGAHERQALDRLFQATGNSGGGSP